MESKGDQRKECERDCVFCGILRNDGKKQIIDRCKDFTAIKKPYKSQQVNFLIISNVHVDNLLGNEETKDEGVDFVALLKFIRKLSKGKHWSMKISNGRNAGQEVFHFHVHINSYEDWDTWPVLKASGQEGLKPIPKPTYRKR